METHKNAKGIGDNKMGTDKQMVIPNDAVWVLCIEELIIFDMVNAVREEEEVIKNE